VDAEYRLKGQVHLHLARYSVFPIKTSCVPMVMVHFHSFVEKAGYIYIFAAVALLHSAANPLLLVLCHHSPIRKLTSRSKAQVKLFQNLQSTDCIAQTGKHHGQTSETSSVAPGPRKLLIRGVPFGGSAFADKSSLAARDLYSGDRSRGRRKGVAMALGLGAG